jgi:hypothetical protein
VAPARPFPRVIVEDDAGAFLGVLDLLPRAAAQWRPAAEDGEIVVPAIEHPRDVPFKIRWPERRAFRASRQATASLRFRETPIGRLVVGRIVFEDSSGVRAAALREIPLGRIEAIVNGPSWSEVVRGLTPPSRVVGKSRGLESREALRIEQPQPKGRRRPDDFYRNVADAYASANRWTRKPAQELAEANEVPITTVHRWVKEARRRELLAPSRRS